MKLKKHILYILAGALSLAGATSCSDVLDEAPDGTFRYERYSIWENMRGGAEMRDKLLPIPLTEAARLEGVTGVKWQNPGW